MANSIHYTSLTVSAQDKWIQTYEGTGSSNGYTIDGVSSILNMKVGNTYNLIKAIVQMIS